MMQLMLNQKDEDEDSGEVTTLELIDQLQANLWEVSDMVAHQRNAISALSMDLLGLTLQTSALTNALHVAHDVLDALAQPPNEEPFDLAFDIMVNAATSSEELVTFTRESLDAALRLAIEEYIHETAQSVI
jgi:hypothetical protein